MVDVRYRHARLLGPRPDRARRSIRAIRHVHTSTCRTHTTRATAERRLPTPPGRPKGCVIGGRILRVNANTPPRRSSWRTSASSSPATRWGSLAVRFRWRALRRACGDGANFDYVDYGQTGGRRARGGAGGRERRRPPRAERCAARICGPAATRSPSTARCIRIDPATGAALPDNPGQWGQRCQSEAHHRLRPAQSLPHHGAPRHVGDLGGRRRLGRPGRKSTASSTRPTERSSNFGWPCYEGNGRQPGYEAAFLTLCGEPLRGRERRRRLSLLHLQPGQQVVSGEACGTGSSSVSGLGVLPDHRRHLSRPTIAGRCSSPTTRASASGRCAASADGHAGTRRGPAGVRRPARAVRSTPEVRPRAASCTTPTSPHRTRCAGCAPSTGNQAPTARAVRRARPQAPRPLAGARSTASGCRATPDAGSALAYAWDLDLRRRRSTTAPSGGGDARSSRVAGSVTGARLRVTDPSRASTTWNRGDRRRRRAAGDDHRRAGAGHYLAGRRHAWAFSGSARSASGDPLPADRAELAARPAPLQTPGGRLPRPHDPGAGGRRVRQLRRARPRVPLLPRAAPHRDRRRPQHDRDPTALPADLPRARGQRAPGFYVFAGSASGPAPLDADVIVGSATSIGAATPQVRDGRTWTFSGWPAPGDPVRSVHRRRAGRHLHRVLHRRRAAAAGQARRAARSETGLARAAWSPHGASSVPASRACGCAARAAPRAAATAPGSRSAVTAILRDGAGGAGAARRLHRGGRGPSGPRIGPAPGPGRGACADDGVRARRPGRRAPLARPAARRREAPAPGAGRTSRWPGTAGRPGCTSTGVPRGSARPARSSGAGWCGSGSAATGTESGAWGRGRLDDVRVYKRALTAAQVAADSKRAVR